MEITPITDIQLKAILDRPEGHFSDFKSKLIKPKSLKKTLIAFANADGGELFVGIEDQVNPESWDGFADPEDANGHVQALDEQFPLGAGVVYTFLTHPDHPGLVLHVEIQKHREIIKSPEGEIYVRRGARNHKVNSSEDIDRLKLNKGIVSYEDNLVNAPISIVENSNTIISFLLEIVPNSEPLPWLEKQLLVENGKPSVACVLLFADEPQVVLPKASIKIYRYRTTDIEGTRETLDGDPETIEGNGYRQIYDAVERVRAIARTIPVVGTTGMEKIEFPEVALHEVIANAVLHRDYSIDDCVHIRIFDNRIEIESPGVLLGHVTVKNILKSRSIRNNKIVRIINKFKNPPNKDVGEGLNSTFQAMRELRLKEPLIEQNELSLIVSLRHERLGSAEEMIIEYLRGNDEINNGMGRELCVINDANRMKRVFQDMVSADVIEAVEGRSKRYAAYRRGKNFPIN